MNSSQAKEILVAPKNTAKINDAKIEESKLRVFTESLEENELQKESYWNKFNTILKSRSPTKYDRVVQFATYPLPIVQETDNILDNYYRLFEGKNRYFDIQADIDVESLKSWIAQEEITKWIEVNSKQTIKNKPLSFCVVDINEKGVPYLVYVDSDRLIDAQFKNDKGDMIYIAFIHSIKTESNIKTTFYAVYDATHYHVFSKSDNQDGYTEVKSIEHNIGYCPAISMSGESSSSSNIFRRKVLFTVTSSSLELWTMFDIYRNLVDHYAPFPVTEAPERACANAECNSGKVSEEQVNYKGEKSIVWSDCQACGGKDDGAHILPGTHIGIQVQEDKETPNGAGVFKMHIPDTDKLKYTPEKLDALAIQIRNKTIGVSSSTEGSAKNKMQIKGSFTSMDNVLVEGKKQLDRLYSWIVETSGIIIYSQEVGLIVHANFGTEFHLMSEADLQESFKTAKEIGLPIEEQIMIYVQIIETKYKGNASKIERQKILLELDPLPLTTVTEAIEMRKEGVIDDDAFNLKINFINFVKRFERENSPVNSFGSNLEYRDRIEIISKTIKNYQDDTRNN